MAKRYHDNMQKGGMISRKNNEFANMPQEVKHVAYPKGFNPCPGGYRDNMEGIDAYARENHKTIAKQKRNPATPY